MHLEKWYSTTLNAPNTTVLSAEMSNSDVQISYWLVATSSTGDSYSFLSWNFFPRRPIQSPAPSLLVDMIPVNNTRQSEKESASGGHFTHGAFQNMTA